MFKNSYVSLADLKSTLGVTSTTDDVALRKTLERASKEVENYCGRPFYSVSATKYFDGDNPLWIPDLLTISELVTDEDGDATYETTFTASDYVLYGGGGEDTLNLFPKNRIELSELSDYGTFAGGIKKGVKITGNWGYGDGTSTPYISDTTLAASIGTANTTASVNSGVNLGAGMTILIGNEQCYINSGSTSLTIERGVNGSTIAAHASGEQIYYYNYSQDIVQACLDLSIAMWQNKSKQGLQSERLGDYSWVAQGTSLNKGMIESILDDRIRFYKKVKV
jgi:hypothetical protein